MGDHQNPLARMPACDFVHCLMHPPGECGQAFPLFWKGELELALPEAVIELGVQALGFGVGQALKETIVTLTQA
ncbi:hypothetical protein MASR2M16_29140 [Thauera terpenica]